MLPIVADTAEGESMGRKIEDRIKAVFPDDETDRSLA
jgi:hypothetical protein